MTSSQLGALADFRYQIRRFLRFSEQAARASGLEPQQHQLLLALSGRRQAEPTIGYLAERLQIRHHSAVELVDRMSEHGWVKRVPSRDDKRRVMVDLTRSGKAVLGKLSAEHLQELRQTGPELVATLGVLLQSGKVGR